MTFSMFCYREAGFNHEHDRVLKYQVALADCIDYTHDWGAVNVEYAHFTTYQYFNIQ